MKIVERKKKGADDFERDRSKNQESWKEIRKIHHQILTERGTCRRACLKVLRENVEKTYWDGRKTGYTQSHTQTRRVC